MEDFVGFVKRVYSDYGIDLHNLLIAYYNSLEGDARWDFWDLLKKDSNEAFGEKSDWDLHIEVCQMAREIPGDAREVLFQLIESPKFDGDVVSKNGKTWLHSKGLAIRIANNGEFGDNAATYSGFKVAEICKETMGKPDPLRKFKDEERPKAECYDCGLPYRDCPDGTVDDALWELINPTEHEGGGLLCPTCIAVRLAATGVTGDVNLTIHLPSPKQPE